MGLATCCLLAFYWMHMLTPLAQNQLASVASQLQHDDPYAGPWRKARRNRDRIPTELKLTPPPVGPAQSTDPNWLPARRQYPRGRHLCPRDCLCASQLLTPATAAPLEGPPGSLEWGAAPPTAAPTAPPSPPRQAQQPAPTPATGKPCHWDPGNVARDPHPRP